jgi:hypothetical protein
MKNLMRALALLTLLPSAAWAQQLCPLGSYNFNGQCLNNTTGVAIIGGQTGTGAGGKGGGLTLLAGAPLAPSTATGDVILFSDPSNSTVNFKCAQPTAGNVGTATCTLNHVTLSGGGSGTVTSVGLTMPTGFTVTGSPVTSSGTLAVSTTLNGVLKGTGSAFTTAASSDVIALWSGTCNSGTFLRADGTCAAAGGGGAAVPATIPDLLYWTKGDAALVSNGNFLTTLQNYTPWLLAVSPFPVTFTTGITVSATQLNSLNVYQWPGSTSGRYEFPLSPNSSGQVSVKLHNVTVFIVANFPAFTGSPTFVGGAAGAFTFRLETSGKMGMLISNTAAIGTETTAQSTSTWFQGNATYNDTTGAFAFRVARAADGSGTNIQAVTAAFDSIGFDRGTSTGDPNAQVAELIIYNRVLTGGEITSVENYLNSKWGI